MLHLYPGIFSGTRAAAAGGVTAVMDMPLNSYPTTTTADRLLEKQKLAKVSTRMTVHAHQFESIP